MIFEFLFLFFGILTIFRNIYLIFGLFGLINLSFYIRKSFYVAGASCILIFFIFQLKFPANYWVFGILCLSSFALKPLVQIYLEQKMRYHFSHILNILVLKMRSGHSFLNAFQSICQESEPILQKKMRNIVSLLEYWNEKQANSLKGFDREIVLRLQAIMQSPSHRLNQIIHLRNEMKMRNDFRNKSMQAAFQTRLQGLILIGVYVITALLMSKTYGFPVIKSWLFFSLPFMVLGTYILMNIPRRFKWKI